MVTDASFTRVTTARMGISSLLAIFYAVLQFLRYKYSLIDRTV